MSNEYRDRLLGIGVISRRGDRPRVREGREHPDSGLPYKAVKTDDGTVTEHSKPGSAVACRQDALVTPKTVRYKLSEAQ